MRRSTLLAIAMMALLLGACDTLFEPVEPSTPDSLSAEATSDQVAAQPGDAAPAKTDETGGVAAGDGTAGAPTIAGGAAADAGATSPARDGEAAVAGETPPAAVAAAGAPLPFDMLSPAEMDQAMAMALDSEVVADAVGAAVDRDSVAATDVAALAGLADQPSYRVVYVQRWPDKSAQGRAAEVLVYRYDTGEPYMTKVDLESGDTEAVDVPAGFPVPVSPSEIAEAAAVARADERVADALAATGLDPDAAQAAALLTTGTAPDARCSEHRCLRLFFLSLRAPTPTFSVVFDTVDLEVVEVESMPARSEP